MTFSECIQLIRQRLELDTNLEAIRIARASLSVLADCLPGTLTEELAAELPSEFASDLRRSDWQPGEQMTLDELVSRAAAHENVTEVVARRHIGVVLETLEKLLPENLMFQLVAALPEGTSRLVGAHYPIPRMHQAVA